MTLISVDLKEQKFVFLNEDSSYTIFFDGKYPQMIGPGDFQDIKQKITLLRQEVEGNTNTVVISLSA